MKRDMQNIRRWANATMNVLCILRMYWFSAVPSHLN